MFSVYEHPWPLLTAAVVALFIVWVLRCIFAGKHWWLWFVPPVLVAAAFGLDFLVQTDAEQIKAVIKTAARAVEEENPAGIEAVIAENYSDSLHHTKKQLIRRCRARLSRPLVQKNITRIVSIDISGTDATAVFTVRMIFDPRSYVYQSFKAQLLIKVQAELQKQHDRWLINRVELLALDLQPATWRNIQQLGH